MSKDEIEIDDIQDDVGSDSDLSFDETDDQNEELGSKSKIAKLRKDLRDAQVKRDEYLAQLQRERADSINVRKAEEEKRSQLKAVVISDLCADLLPVLDSFESAMVNKTVWESVDKNWRIGVEYIYQQLVKTIEGYGVETINPMGQEFDPVTQEVYEHREVASGEDVDRVIEVLQKGYRIKGSIIRPARVVIGKLQA